MPRDFKAGKLWMENICKNVKEVNRLSAIRVH